MIYLLVFGVALVTAVLLTPPVRKLAFGWGLIAAPGGRRQHSGLVPTLGGVPSLAAYLLSIGLIYLLLPPQGDDSLRL